MLITIMSTVSRWIKKEMEYRRTVYELNRLTSRDLADLGVQHCQIEFIARTSADKKFAV
jgi:uncharacterized protein YjiS (DUF1127 family)